MFGCNNDRRFPEKYTVKDSFFGVSSILIVSSSFLVLFRVSIWLLLLLTLIGCTGSLSMGVFLLRVTISRSERAWEEDDCQVVFQFRMIWVNFIIFVFLFTLNPFRLRILVQVAKCLGSLQEQKRTFGETGMVCHHIFLRKTAIIITSKHGTTIFYPITILF